MQLVVRRWNVPLPLPWPLFGPDTVRWLLHRFCRGNERGQPLTLTRRCLRNLRHAAALGLIPPSGMSPVRSPEEAHGGERRPRDAHHPDTSLIIGSFLPSIPFQPPPSPRHNCLDYEYHFLSNHASFELNDLLQNKATEPRWDTNMPWFTPRVSRSPSRPRDNKTINSNYRLPSSGRIRSRTEPSDVSSEDNMNIMEYMLNFDLDSPPTPQKILHVSGSLPTNPTQPPQCYQQSF